MPAGSGKSLVHQFAALAMPRTKTRLTLLLLKAHGIAREKRIGWRAPNPCPRCSLA